MFLLATKDPRHRHIKLSAEVQADSTVRLVILVQSPNEKYTVLDTAITLTAADAQRLAAALT